MRRAYRGWIIAAGMCVTASVAAGSSGQPERRPAAEAAQAGEAAPVRVTRADLGFAYLRFDRAYAGHMPQDPAEIERIGRGFDRATFAFFGGGFAEAVRQVDALTHSLLPPPEGTAAEVVRQMALSLRARVDPPVVIIGSEAPKLWIERMYTPTGGQEPPPAQAAITIQVQFVRVTTGEVGHRVDVPWNADTPGGLAVDLPEALRLPAGTYDVRIGLHGDHQRTTSRLFIVARSLEQERNELLTAAEALLGTVDPDLRRPVEILLARANLLSDAPLRRNSAQFLALHPELVQELRAELGALEQGRTPYRHRPGDLWRTFSIETAELPVRVYAPQAVIEAGAAGAGGSPLVIALHGAGGDENMFPDAYGGGIIKALADEHGFVLASPLSAPTASMPVFFDSLVDELAADYPIDRTRIHVLGHSMGAGVTAAWARQRPEQIASAACIAGFSTFTAGQAIPPVLVLAAEFDALIPARRIDGALRSAAGLPVEYRLSRHEGHTTVVGRELPMVIRWLLKPEITQKDPQEETTR